MNANADLLPESLARYIREVTPELEKIAPVRNRVAHGRPLNYDDLARTLEHAEAFVAATQANWQSLRTTLHRLRVEPSFVLGLEIPSSGVDVRDQKHNLPTPDFDETGFLGRKQQVDQMQRICLGPYPVITISGEGGVGKTALALKVAYELLDRE